MESRALTGIAASPRKWNWRGVHITRVTKQRPSRDLQARFALYVLNRLPAGGFVIDSNDLWRWVRVAGDAHDSVPEPGLRPSRSGRLSARFGGSPRPTTDA